MSPENYFVRDGYGLVLPLFCPKCGGKAIGKCPWCGHDAITEEDD